MLALAAQNLTACGSADYSIHALNHRVRAIAAMNEALSTPSAFPVDGDARLATTIVLTFQSTYMDDGMMEFLRMLRGWLVIQTSVIPSMDRSIFRGFTEDAYVESMRTYLGQDMSEALPTNSAREKLYQALEDFEASLRLVGPLCQSPAELQYLSSLQRVVRVARDNPNAGMSLDNPKNYCVGQLTDL